MKKILLFFFILLFLTGCTQKQINFKINDDLSSTIDFFIKLIDNYNSEITTETLKIIKKDAINNGYAVINEPNKKKIYGNYFDAHKYFTSNDLLNGNVSKELKRNGIELDLQRQTNQKGNKILILKGILNNENIHKNLIKTSLGRYFMDNLNQFIISIPNKPIKHNADIESDYGKTLMWRINDNIDKDIYMEMNITDSIKHNYYFIITILLLLVVFSYLLKRYVSKKT